MSRTSGKRPPDGQSHDQVLHEESINLTHMELLTQYLSDEDILGLSISIGPWLPRVTQVFQIALQSSYLLYQLLAFAARRLAFLRPALASSYMHQATTLQTRAVELFNAAWSPVDQSNFVAVTLFSSVLGHHVLTDALAARKPGGMEPFLAQFVQCVEMLRGVHSIAMDSWPLLLESSLEPILSSSAAVTSRAPKGNHCQRVRELVDTSDRIDDAARKACRQAINSLQVGFDTALGDEEERGVRYHMIFGWMLVIPPEFTVLLAARRPEALVVLSYYASLLHLGRSMWQVGDAGRYIFGLITNYLEPQWQYWLEYPRQMIEG